MLIGKATDKRNQDISDADAARQKRVGTPGPRLLISSVPEELAIWRRIYIALIARGLLTQWRCMSPLISFFRATNH
jgi:hypothetical protein